MLPWTAPSTLPRSGSHGVLAHQQRGLAGHRGGEGLVQLRSTCRPALSATATWQASRPSAQRQGFCRARPQRGLYWLLPSVHRILLPLLLEMRDVPCSCLTLCVIALGTSVREKPLLSRIACAFTGCRWMCREDNVGEGN